MPVGRLAIAVLRLHLAMLQFATRLVGSTCESSSQVNWGDLKPILAFTAVEEVPCPFLVLLKQFIVLGHAIAVSDETAGGGHD